MDIVRNADGTLVVPVKPQRQHDGDESADAPRRWRRRGAEHGDRARDPAPPPRRRRLRRSAGRVGPATESRSCTGGLHGHRPTRGDGHRARRGHLTRSFGSRGRRGCGRPRRERRGVAPCPRRRCPLRRGLRRRGRRDGRRRSAPRPPDDEDHRRGVSNRQVSRPAREASYGTAQPLLASTRPVTGRAAVTALRDTEMLPALPARPRDPAGLHVACAVTLIALGARSFRFRGPPRKRGQRLLPGPGTPSSAANRARSVPKYAMTGIDRSVVLIAGQVSLPDPEGVKLTRVIASDRTR